MELYTYWDNSNYYRKYFGYKKVINSLKKGILLVSGSGNSVVIILVKNNTIK